MSANEEPLAESAPIAWRLAPQLCHRDPANGESCAWYHGIWQFLRIMGLTSSAAQRAEFYHRSIQAACAGSDSPRILVSGTADYAMPALVIAALKDRSIRPAITVTDICKTPLHLSRWYAERESSRLETACGDILEYRAPAAFDVVCTDGFFSRLPAARRPALVAKWRQLLRPGGQVITTNRLHPDGTNDRKVGFSAARAQVFRDTALRAIAERRDAIRVDPEELMRQADIYARKHDTYPLVSMDEIRRLFEEAGFRIDRLSAISRAREQRDGENDAAARKKAAMQMHLVATRL